MRLGLSVPKMNAGAGADGGDGPILSSVKEGAEAFLSRTAGKALLMADSAAFSALLPASRLSRAVSLIYDGDALAPFALSDVGCVLASGGADVLRAARFFAEVRRLPCALFPTQAACDGAFETSARVRLSGQEMQVRLADADVVCDLTLMHNSMAEGYARILLTRLALFEAKMLGRICRRPFGGVVYEEAFSLTDGVRALRAEEIVKINARVRVLEEQGAPIGEGTVLRERYAGVPIPALYAQRALSALYYAALKKGVPRRYFVPDYRARAAAAGIKYADQDVPAPSEYAARAMALERARGELLTEIVHLRREHPAQLREIRTQVRLLPFTPDLHELNCLPERAPGGLCAVLRDFGLLENI